MDYNYVFSLQVSCQGDVIGGVLAMDRDTAQRAARSVIVTYKDLPHILTIEVHVTIGFTKEDVYIQLMAVN